MWVVTLNTDVKIQKDELYEEYHKGTGHHRITATRRRNSGRWLNRGEGIQIGVILPHRPFPQRHCHSPSNFGQTVYFSWIQCQDEVCSGIFGPGLECHFIAIKIEGNVHLIAEVSVAHQFPVAGVGQTLGMKSDAVFHQTNPGITIHYCLWKETE